MADGELLGVTATTEVGKPTVRDARATKRENRAIKSNKAKSKPEQAVSICYVTVQGLAVFTAYLIHHIFISYIL